MWMWSLPTGQTPIPPWRVSDCQPRLHGAVGGELSQRQYMLFCNMRGWEILMKPLPVLDRRPLALTKRGVCFCGQVYVFFLWHIPEHITSNMTIFPRLSSLYFSPPVSLYFSSVSAGSLASTGSPNCTRSQPSLLFRSRIIRPLWGKLVYFWVGLTRYKPYWVLFFFNALALPFPHIYLMLPPFISFRHFQFLTLLSLPCHVGITDTWAPFLSFHTNSQTTGSIWVKGWRRTDLTEIFSILSSLPPSSFPLRFHPWEPTDCGRPVCHSDRSRVLAVTGTSGWWLAGRPRSLLYQTF